MKTRTHFVEVIIGNKPTAGDPEGETILRDLVTKGGYSQVTSMRVGKLLRVTVEAENGSAAKRIIQSMCDDLRIYNPAAHSCIVRVVGAR